MIGVEIQDPRASPTPASATGSSTWRSIAGLLLLPCGPSTLRICPPLCLTGRQVEIGLNLIDAAMTAAVEETNRMQDELRESEERRKESERELEKAAPERS